MITLHEENGSEIKLARPESLLKRGFSESDIRFMIDASAQAPEGKTPELLNKNYYLTFNDSFMIDLGVATALQSADQCTTEEISDLLGLSIQSVENVRSEALRKLKRDGKIQQFARLASEYRKIKNIITTRQGFEYTEEITIEITEE